MSSSKQVEELNILTRAKYPLLYIIAWEERRIEDILRQVAIERRKQLYLWTLTNGIVHIDAAPYSGADPVTRNPLSALESISQSQEAAIFVLKDFHTLLDRHSNPDQPVIVRKVRDVISQLKGSRKTLVILSPVLEYPPELEKDITILDYSLPGVDELAQSLERVVRSAREISGAKLILPEGHRELVLNAARGLTCTEAENVFSKSLVMNHTLDVDVIISEKEQLIRRSRALEYHHAVQDFSSVGGMDLLKQWLGKRGRAFTEKARRFGLPEPKGLLLLGVQGAGKSLVAKAVASQWHLPLLRLDLGRIFSELVGSSEHNIRGALRMAEGVAPCVLWIDEIEKGLGGVASSHQSDAGTTARIFGSILTWMQEKTSPVFVIATANNVSMLPPEMLRKGRFDEIFFVDLPLAQERREIFAIHLAQRGRDPLRFDLNRLALSAKGFSGAEIEQVVISGLYDAFEEERELTTQDMLNNVHATMPLSRTMEKEITLFRRWGREHARPASTPEQVRAAVGNGYATPVHQLELT